MMQSTGSLPRRETVESGVKSWRSRARQWLAICVAASGLVNLVEGLIPKSFDVLEWMAQYLPFHVCERSRMLLVTGGFLQLMLSRGLLRGKRTAWTLSLALLVLTPFLHLGRAFDWHHAVLQSVLAIALVIWREEFFARSDGPSIRWAFFLGGSAFLTITAFGLLTLRHFSGEISGSNNPSANLQTVLELVFVQDTDTLEPVTQRAQAAFQTISETAIVFGILILFLLLKPILPRGVQTEAERKIVEQVIARHGRDPLDEFALLPDKYYYFYGDGERTCVTPYALWRDFAVTLANPIGPPDALPHAIADFDAFCKRQDWQPTFYEVPETSAPTFRDAGFRTFKVAEDACIDLRAFSLSGGKFQNLRSARNKVRKSGWRYDCFSGDALEPSLRESLQAISSDWLASRHGAQLTFDLGSFAPPSLQRADIVVLFDEKNQPVAFASWLPYSQGTGRSLDLMRHHSSHRGVMDALIVESLLDFQRRGIAEASLGNAPLANIEHSSLDSLEEKAVRYLFERFDRYYGYKSLFEFKRKFHPAWRGRHVAYRNIAHLLPAAAAIVSVHLPNGFMKYIRS
jgi:phosphatidylglycerol lysyltransferase